MRVGRRNHDGTDASGVQRQSRVTEMTLNALSSFKSYCAPLHLASSISNTLLASVSFSSVPPSQPHSVSAALILEASSSEGLESASAAPLKRVIATTMHVSLFIWNSCSLSTTPTRNG